MAADPPAWAQEPRRRSAEVKEESPDRGRRADEGVAAVQRTWWAVKDSNLRPWD
jgi:hypothetical protein